MFCSLTTAAWLPQNPPHQRPESSRLNGRAIQDHADRSMLNSETIGPTKSSPSGELLN